MGVVVASLSTASGQLLTLPGESYGEGVPALSVDTEPPPVLVYDSYGGVVHSTGADDVRPVAVGVPALSINKRSADAQLVIGYPAGYAAFPYGLASFAPLVAHPNGAVVPLEPKDVSCQIFYRSKTSETFLGC